MSTGLVICSSCCRVVHQDGPNSSWQHCEDGTRICVGARARYPLSPDEVKGPVCEADVDHAAEKQTRRVLMPAGGLAMLAGAAALGVAPPARSGRPVVTDPRRREAWRDNGHEPHQGKREKERRRRQQERNAANAAKRAAKAIVTEELA